MELTVLGLFCLLLISSLLFHFSIVLALLGGLALFLGYSAARGHSPRALLTMVFSGIATAKNVLLTLLVIGVLTALWRAAGTIAAIVSFASVLIRPSVVLLMSFLLNCLVSFLTGTAFGTGATMGVICAAVASAVHVSPVLTGGAILSGSYFGDRCSPVSTSMLLVAEITKTDPYDNIRTMLRNSLVPFLFSCAIYAAAGLLIPSRGDVPELRSLFAAEFSLSPVTLLPAAVILILALLRVRVRTAMYLSILTALPICLLVQHFSLPELARFALFGFQARGEALAPLLNGGGVSSMLRGFTIVCISSAYAGIFQTTGLLRGIQKYIGRIAGQIGACSSVLLTSVLTAMASCNQTLSIMLTEQLCRAVVPDKRELAALLENTVVVIAPLIPWSIAGSTVLASCGLPLSGIAAACYLYLLPLWTLAVSLKKGKTSHE